MSSLKTCIVIAAELISEVGVILEDKKVKFAEVVGLVPHLLKLPKFVSNVDAAVKELKNGITAEYSIEINNAVAKSLNLPNEKAEDIVEICINWIVITSSTVFQVVKVVKK